MRFADFLIESSPSREHIEQYINHNYYVYGENGNTITIEDTYKKVRCKYKIRIGTSGVTVTPELFGDDKNAHRAMSNRAKQIRNEIMRNATKFKPSDSTD